MTNDLGIYTSENKRLTAIQNEADKLKDVCMLGDAAELLEKLASFEEKEF